MEATMKRILSFALLIVVFLVPSVWCQNLEEAGVDYTTALQKTPGDQRISAFKEYVKKYAAAKK